MDAAHFSAGAGLPQCSTSGRSIPARSPGRPAKCRQLHAGTGRHALVLRSTTAHRSTSRSAIALQAQTDSLDLADEALQHPGPEASSNGAVPGPHHGPSAASARTSAAGLSQSLQQLKAGVNAIASPSTSAASPAAVGDDGADAAPLEQPPETGVLPIAAAELAVEEAHQLIPPPVRPKRSKKEVKEGIRKAREAHEARALPPSPAAASAAAADAATAQAAASSLVYPEEERTRIRNTWIGLMRWSRSLRKAAQEANKARLHKVVIFGGGSFGTAMGVALSRAHPGVHITLLLRDAYLCRDINEKHRNTRYLPDWDLPVTITATTSAAEAIAGAQYAIHAVPVQHTRAFLEGIKDLIPPALPLISVSKGVEVSTGQLMSDLIPSALGRKQPAAFLSGPSFASEVMAQRPTGIVAASRDKALAAKVQQLFASPTMRVNTSSDVVGVEICGALKNVLAIAAGIVEGLDLGHNAMAALVAQGCAEIRWLAEKMGAKSATVSGLSGLGDIMLTCYGSLSRNRSVGVRLGKGEALSDITASSSQVAEGVATAGVVVGLSRKYRVQLPVLIAVAQVLDGHISAREAVAEIMNLPQMEER